MRSAAGGRARRALLALAACAVLPGCRARVIVRGDAPERRPPETGAELSAAEAAPAFPRNAPVAAPRRESGWSFVDVPRPRVEPRVVAAQGKVYVLGGSRPNQPGTYEVDVFDPATGAWAPASPLPAPLGAFIAAELDGKIYVAGGCVAADCARMTRAAYAYDPALGTWSELAPMPEARALGGGVSADGRFYVLGGMDGRVATASVFAYDPRRGAWSREQDMPRARLHFAAMSMGGRVYAAGGCVDPRPYKYCSRTSETVDVLDARSGSWSAGPPLPRAMGALGGGVVGGKIYVVGGYPQDGGRPVDDVHVLASGAAAWSAGPRLLEPYYAPGVVSVGGALFAYGSDHRNWSLARMQALDWAGAAAADEPRASVPDVDSLPARAASPRKGHALIIGVERYREPLPRADFAADDARLVGRYASAVLGLPEENVAVLSDERATRGDFEKYVERWLPNRVEAGDEVFVYFSGHGAPNPKTGDAYLVPYDGDPTYIEQTGYPLRRLYESLGKLPAERVIVAMDSCFSGAGGRSVLAKGARPLVSAIAEVAPPSKLTVISASAGDQISNSYQEKGHGLFTYFFLKGLKEKGPDYKAVFDYLKPEVARVARRDYNADQDPQWREGR